MARQRIVANEAFKAPVRRTLREEPMLRERLLLERRKDRSLCPYLAGVPMRRERSKDRNSCQRPAEAAEVQAQWWYPARAKPAAEASSRRQMQAGGRRYSVHLALPVQFRQLHLDALRVFSLRSVKPIWRAAAQHRLVSRVVGRSVSSPGCFPLIQAAVESLRCSI